MEEDDIALEPLDISCTSTDCENGLHCFLQKRKVGPVRVGGPCRSCGAELVEFKRVGARDLSDVDYTFSALRNELIRHEFWHRPFDVRALNHARRKGRRLLREAARSRIETSVGRANNPRDGRQTPFHGNTLYYAQHAVAACCRKCIEYWHGIPTGRRLATSEIGYLTDLVNKYIDERLPDLENEPVKVPAIRKRARGNG